MGKFRVVTHALLGVAVAALLFQPLLGIVLPRPGHDGLTQGGSGASLSGLPTVLPAGGDYPSYLGGPARDGVPTHESLVTEPTAGSLHPLWSFSEVGSFLSQPVEANGVVYIGSQNGYEYAINSLTGAQIWSTYLGQDSNDSACGTTTLGIVSTPTVSGNSIVLYGGDGKLYDVNTRNGHISWSTVIGNTSQGFYGWGSPLLHGRYVYLGVASRCDSPLVAGGLVQVSLSTHQVVGFFNTTAPGLVGNSVWSSPAMNTSANTIFVTTGNPNGSDPLGLGEAIISLNATTLALENYWQVPPAQAIGNGDFGSTPTLFTPKGQPAMVAAVNKNGYVYAWYQSNLTLAWERSITSKNTVTSLSWSGRHLYVLGPNTTISSVNYPSAVRELNPTTGAVVWQSGLPTPHTGYASPLWSNAALVVAENTTVRIMDGYNGHTLTTLAVNGPIQAPPSLARGELYVATGHGYLYAYDLNLSATISPSQPSGALAPLFENFTANPVGGLPRYLYNWSFGDGGYSSLSSPAHIYLQSGNYNVTVTVTDLAGSSVTTRTSLTAM